MTDCEKIFSVLEKVEKTVEEIRPIFHNASISFDVDLKTLEELTEKTSLSNKKHLTKGEWLRLSFDWANLQVFIYCHEEKDYSLIK